MGRPKGSVTAPARGRSRATGFYTFSAEFKGSYVQALKAQKIIGLEEATSPTDVLFNKYYFGSENISLTQLVGIHYMNDGLFLRDKDDIDGAYEQLKKAYFYYPGTRCEFLLMSFTLMKMEDQKTDPVTKAALIGTVSRMKRSTITPEMIKGEFSNLTQETLLRKNDRVLYKQCFDELARHVTDTTLLHELSYIFYYENGRVYYNSGNFVKARPFFVQALRLEPKSSDLGGILVSCLGQSFRNIRNNRVLLDSLERYRELFPTLNENANFNSMLCLTYAGVFGDAYEAGKISDGEKYQRLFENLYRSENNLNIVNTDIIGRAYSNACTYYFKKGQKAKAQKFLDIGLELVPDDYQLKMRRQMINR